MKNKQQLKAIPKGLKKGFGLCVFGKPTEETLSLANQCGLVSVEAGSFTDFMPTDATDFSPLFGAKQFEYMDGFSPNLNKHLHVGHMSNFVIAKAFQCMGVAKKTVAMLGDTVHGDVDQAEALAAFEKYCADFGYTVDAAHMASNLKYSGAMSEGCGEYAGSKVIDVNGAPVVLVKSNGTTSYFYHDLAFAELLSAPTLYLTGYEQCGHFQTLKAAFGHIEHVGLGLVKYKGKMSSRNGNVVMASELLGDLNAIFDGNECLSYNVFAGQILKNNPVSDKLFDLEIASNPVASPGLYVSYTEARLKSAGVNVAAADKFNSPALQYHALKAKAEMNPATLFNALYEHCADINQLYKTHKIAGNADNKKMFEAMFADLQLGMDAVGLLHVDKV